MLIDYVIDFYFVFLASRNNTSIENQNEQNPSILQLESATSVRISTCANNSTVDIDSVTETEKAKKSQSTLREFIIRPVSISRQKKINKCLIELIVTDLQPFSIVEDIGFINYTRALDQSFKLPSRTTLSRTLLPQLYEKCVVNVQEMLNNSEHIALTTDTWTSLACEGYMAITAHYISRNWEMQSLLLSCNKVSNKHTAENLRNLLLIETNKWNITKKVHTVITDNAANMVAAIKLTGWNHYGCFAHTLNLIIQDSIAVKNPLHLKVKAIVEFFHRSTVASEKFKEIQAQMSTDMPLKLPMDVVTRWNSIYHMF